MLNLLDLINFLKDKLEMEEKITTEPIDSIISSRLKKLWKETKTVMKLYENDYDFTEDTLGDI